MASNLNFWKELRSLLFLVKQAHERKCLFNWRLSGLGPDLFVIRCSGDDPLDEVARQSQIPVINAGFGAKAHPTQALLDTFTILETFKSCEGLKVLYVGDIDHSRVASSGIKLLQSFGADVKLCAPRSFCQKDWPVENNENLDEALGWCDVYIGLRVQFEPHNESTGQELSEEDFIQGFSLNSQRLEKLNKDAIIMHPGPVNWGLEFQSCVQQDSRLVMWRQKENGVYTRAALMDELLKGLK